MCSSETLCTGNSLHGRVLRGTRGEGGRGQEVKLWPKNFCDCSVFLQSVEGAFPGEGPCHARGIAGADGRVWSHSSAALY